MIPFHRPYISGRELSHLAESQRTGHLSGDGTFTRRCSAWLERQLQSPSALLTHSCTAALEMAAVLADIQPGDEIILPSYTFVSTANAFVLRGGVPVFVDIRPDTLNLDEQCIEASITARTRAIIPVHYAGIPCAMDTIMATARRHDLLVIEDAAQGILSHYHGRPLGSIGDMGCLSFHATKNIVAGEGGALLINNTRFSQRAEIIRRNGTNRCQMDRGETDKYTWVDMGSSYLPSELNAAFLWSQLQEADGITERRLRLWHTYHEAFAGLERQGRLRRPVVPDECRHNGHVYYLLLRDHADRQRFLQTMLEQGIQCVFHYVPLHSSPHGRRVGRAIGDMSITTDVANRLVRLPLWIGLEPQQQQVIQAVLRYAQAY